MKSYRIFSVLIVSLAVLLGSCRNYTEFEQTVRVKVKSDGRAVEGRNFRYHSEKDCGGPFQTGITSANGSGELKRSAKRGSVVVLLEEPSLCFAQGDIWYSAWQAFIDPADVQEFACEVQVSGRILCSNPPSAGGSN